MKESNLYKRYLKSEELLNIKALLVMPFFCVDIVEYNSVFVLSILLTLKLKGEIVDGYGRATLAYIFCLKSLHCNLNCTNNYV